MDQENQHIEWKESWRDDYLKWICGFANAEGGILLKENRLSYVGSSRAVYWEVLP
ncbi:MAG: ATP-binding protein [Chlorobiales bacterium]|nr:ATP-binding protein [Chlorobiales bacterium]